MLFEAYQFRDLVGISGASRHEVDSWVRKGAITPDIASSTGTGVRREFSFLDLFETCVARELNQLVGGGLSVQMIQLALDALRYRSDPRSPELNGFRDRLTAHTGILIPTDFPDAWLLSLMRPAGQPPPPTPEVQPWREFLDPVTRDQTQRTGYWLGWNRDSRLADVIEGDRDLARIATHIPSLVLVNLRRLLLELEERSADHWMPHEEPAP